MYTDIATEKIGYGFYADQLAFALVQLDGSFEDVQRNLDAKYPRVINVDRNVFGDGGAPGQWEGMSFTGTLYKRGTTNTRIFLMRSSNNDGETTEVDLLYLPNANLLAIRNGWWADYNTAQEEVVKKGLADVDAVRAKDQTAIQ
jgi:hypothetical protein